MTTEPRHADTNSRQPLTDKRFYAWLVWSLIVISMVIGSILTLAKQ